MAESSSLTPSFMILLPFSSQFSPCMLDWPVRGAHSRGEGENAFLTASYIGLELS